MVRFKEFSLLFFLIEFMFDSYIHISCMELLENTLHIQIAATPKSKEHFIIALPLGVSDFSLFMFDFSTKVRLDESFFCHMPSVMLLMDFYIIKM